jgi:CRISPR-associated DxTHG motif protein
MGQTVFLSTLGTSAYDDVSYVPLNGEDVASSAHTPFIQEARLEALAAQGIRPDTVLIYVTAGDRGSLVSNWTARTVRPHPGETQFARSDDGLRKRMHARGFIDDPIVIPSGQSETELWEIFEAISESVNEGDDLYVDVTHGFRTLPIVLLTALEYLQRAKGVHIRQVTYGAYEARVGAGPAPTFDLTPFFIIREWTAALVLLDSGDFRALGSVMDAPVVDLAKILKSRCPVHLRALPGSLQKLGDALWNNRIRDLPRLVQVTNDQIDEVKRDFDVLGTLGDAEPSLRAVAKALGPIVAVLNKLQEKLKTLQAAPGHPPEMCAILAARFCIEHGLIVQGLTLFRETLLDIVLRIAVGEAETENDRKSLDPFLTGFKFPEPNAALVPEPYREKFELLHCPPHTSCGGISRYDQMRPLVTKVMAWRNALDHCGTDPENRIGQTNGLRKKALEAVDDLEKWLGDGKPDGGV